MSPNGSNEKTRLPKNTKCFPFSTRVNNKTIPDSITYRRDKTLNTVK